MMRPTCTLVLGCLCVVLSAAPTHGQSASTGSIGGTVRVSDGTDAEGVAVVITNTATGGAVSAHVRHGRFLVTGLDAGGPYSVAFTRVGLHPRRLDGLVVRVGEPVRVVAVLYPVAVPLDAVTIPASVEGGINYHGGTATHVPKSLLDRLPTLNRNLYDFARLSPQISTRVGIAGGGISAAGAGFRYNAFRVDGVPQRSIGGHVPPEFAGLRSIPFDAIAEYQLLVAPFDVRYGDFAGAVVEAVTRSGTNRVSGAAFMSGRNDVLARRVGQNPYERLLYGFNLGGPIRRNRAHFFVAAEMQHLSSLAAGPYVGQPSSARRPVPISGEDILRFEDALRSHGLIAGSAAAVYERNPQASIFARLDLSFPGANSRARVSYTESRARPVAFSREAVETFPFSTNSSSTHSAVRNGALLLRTSLTRASGGHNELSASYREAGLRGRASPAQPIVRVAIPAVWGGFVDAVAGPPPQGQGGRTGGWAINVSDELTLPAGRAHVITLGAEMERFVSQRSGVPNSYGTWTFSSIDSLVAGLPQRFDVQRDFGSAGVPFTGSHLAAYAGDSWDLSRHLTLTGGVRAEMLFLHGRPAYSRTVDSLFGRRTDRVPIPRLALSPRIGFTWQPPFDHDARVRGGIGVFTARPPGAWLHAPYQNYGAGIGVLRCGPLPGDIGPPPAFSPDHISPPTECANGEGPSGPPPGDVELLAGGLALSQTLRGVIAIDRRIAARTTGSIEAVMSRTTSDYAFANLALVGPRGVDRHGRVMYGTVGATGIATRDAVGGLRQDVIELSNAGRAHSLQMSARLDRHDAGGNALIAHYTFSRVRDFQTPLRINNPAATNWALRAVSGRHDDRRPEISLNDIPHRAVLAATRRIPWRRHAIGVSVYYIGESGGPFTYRAFSPARGRGDLNADGSNTNDPIYVPRDARDTAEIRFGRLVRSTRSADGTVHVDTLSAELQADAFERFVAATPCLDSQRGRIAARNSCRDPWTNALAVALRSELAIGGHHFDVQMDVYNLLNLLDHTWGQYRTRNPALLEHVGQSSGDPGALPVFTFDEGRARASTVPAESNYQLQLTLRYRF